MSGEATLPFSWPSGAQCAVSLTYDDGLAVHHALVGPLLAEQGLRGTFYPTLRPDNDLLAQPDAWRALAAAGHEIGNHSLFHPCRMPDGPLPWLADCYNLCDYTPARLHDELAVANNVLRLIDGQTERTYGTTCCHTTIGRGAGEQSMAPIIADLFVAVRGAMTGQPVRVASDFDRMNVGCIGVDGRTLEELIACVEEVRSVGGWAVLVAHGVGAETHPLHLAPDVHRGFVQWLADRKETVWTAPFRDVAKFVLGNLPVFTKIG